MITFGFKNNKSIYSRAAVSFLLGLSLVLITFALRKNENIGLFDVLAMVTGAGIGLFGLIELIICLTKKDRSGGEKTWMLVSAVSTLLLGVIICFTAKFLATAFSVLIALFLLVIGIYQIVILVSALRVIRFSALFFVLPGLVVIFGALVLIGGLAQEMQDFICYAAGVSLITYAVSDLMALSRVKKAMAASAPEEQDAVVATVEEGKVDEQ